MASNCPDAVPVKEYEPEPLPPTPPDALAENVAEPVACGAALAEPVKDPDSEPVAVRTVVAEAHSTEPHFVAPQPDVAMSYPSLGEAKPL